LQQYIYIYAIAKSYRMDVSDLHSQSRGHEGGVTVNQIHPNWAWFLCGRKHIFPYMFWCIYSDYHCIRSREM